MELFYYLAAAAAKLLQSCLTLCDPTDYSSPGSAIPGILQAGTVEWAFFIIRDWTEKVGSQETPGVTGKFGLGIQNEAGKMLIVFCQENALVINTLFQQHKRRLYTWTRWSTLKSD